MKKWIYLLTALLVVGAMVLSACKPDYCAQDWVAPTPTPAEPAPDPTELVFERVIADHVILVGPKKMIRDLIDSVSEAESLLVRLSESETNGIEAMCPSAAVYSGTGYDWGPMPKLERVARINLPYVDQALKASCPAMPQSSWYKETKTEPKESGWAMELYQISDAQAWVETLIASHSNGGTSATPPQINPGIWVAAALNCQSAQMYGTPLVLADPTFLTGKLSANPWTAEGSPWTAEGSGGDPKEAAAAFWNQWAFSEEPGVNLGAPNTGTGEWERDTSLSTGQGVVVGVFDSSPFEKPSKAKIDWITPTLDLTVRHLEPLNMPKDTPNMPMSNHGLFVSGLIHAVAPDSEIRLYRVLGPNMQGDMWTLNYALDSFIRKMITARKLGMRKGAVINLSMGGLEPKDYPVTRWQEGLGDLEEIDPRDRWDKLLPWEVVSLGTLLSAAHCHGIVSVASAGNDSYNRLQTRANPQIPSNFSEVISVSARNALGDLSCFTNEGAVAAPGGDSRKPIPCSDDVEPDECCKPSLDECTLESCEFGLTSVVLQCKEQGYESGYAYWAGTSFSAPLISGLAALVLEESGGWSTDKKRPPDGSFADSVTTAITGDPAEINTPVDAKEILTKISP